MVIGIVGRARWGRILEETVKKDPRVERVVVRGRSWEDLLDSRLSGVMVACPPAYHVDVARPFLEAGIPLFIEKPLALTRADAESLAEMAALRPRVPILVDHLLLFSELYAPIRERVHRGRAEGATVDRMWITWTGAKKREDTPALWDYASHVIALALDLFGPEITFIWDSGHEEYTSIVSIEGGPFAGRGRMESGFVDPDGEFPREPYRHLTLDMRERSGVISITWDENRKVAYSDAGFSVSEKTPPLDLAVRVFLDSIEGKPDPRLGLGLGVKVVSKLAGLERAAKLRR